MRSVMKLIQNYSKIIWYLVLSWIQDVFVVNGTLVIGNKDTEKNMKNL